MDAKLGPGVREALARGTQADVVVALTSDSVSERDPAAARVSIARMQDAVLSTLDTADFQLRQRYAAVPALAGTLRAPRALDRLLAHPLVRRVDLDTGGGGTSVP